MQWEWTYCMCIYMLEKYSSIPWCIVRGCSTVVIIYCPIYNVKGRGEHRKNRVIVVIAYTLECTVLSLFQ